MDDGNAHQKVLHQRALRGYEHALDGVRDGRRSSAQTLRLVHTSHLLAMELIERGIFRARKLKPILRKRSSSTRRNRRRETLRISVSRVFGEKMSARLHHLRLQHSCTASALARSLSKRDASAQSTRALQQDGRDAAAMVLLR